MKDKIFARTLLLSLMVLAVCFAGFSKEKAVESMWVGSSLSIDGSDNDWIGDTLNCEEKCKVDYAFRNDADNLYVLFVLKDPKYQSTIKDTGMTLWINTEGKKKKKYGIHFYTKRVPAEGLISVLEKQKGPLPEAEKNKIRGRPFYFFYQGEVKDKKGKILTPTALGGELAVPLFRAQAKQKMMIYEFVMSLRILEKLSAKHKMEPGKTVKVGFEWGGLTEQMKAQRRARRQRSGGGGGARSGGGGGVANLGGPAGQVTGGRSGASRMSKVPKKYSFWVDVGLAQKD